MLNCVTSMDSIGNSGKCCLEIPWGSLVQSVEAGTASTQVSPAPPPLTHTSLSLCACTYTPNDNFYQPSLFLAVFRALHHILEIQLLTPAGLSLLSVLSSRLDYTP